MRPEEVTADLAMETLAVNAGHAVMTHASVVGSRLEVPRP